MQGWRLGRQWWGFEHNLYDTPPHSHRASTPFCSGRFWLPSFATWDMVGAMIQTFPSNFWVACFLVISWEVHLLCHEFVVMIIFSKFNTESNWSTVRLWSDFICLLLLFTDGNIIALLISAGITRLLKLTTFYSLWIGKEPECSSICCTMAFFSAAESMPLGRAHLLYQTKQVIRGAYSLVFVGST